jgi:hypothetical protein
MKNQLAAVIILIALTALGSCRKVGHAADLIHAVALDVCSATDNAESCLKKCETALEEEE